MTFKDVRRALTQWTVQAIKPGLARTQALLKLCGHPDRHFPTIQVAGTNGKGSVTIMLSSILTEAGYKTGCYSSPHLITEKERIIINQKPVSTPLLVQSAQVLLPALQTMMQQGRPVTTFEAWTVLAALVFAQAQVKVAVIEVGLGGRFDATTALSHRMLTLLTNINLDHTAFLGATKAEICFEKMGIAKKGVPLLSSEQDPAVRRCMHTLAKTKGAPLYFCGSWSKDRIQLLEQRDVQDGCQVRLQGPWPKPWLLTAALHGSFQALNISLAVMAAQWLEEQGWEISRPKMEEGLHRVVWPGRMEQLYAHPRVVLDGGHNPSAIAAVLKALHPRPQSITLVLGMMKDKAAAEMVASLAPWVRQAWVFPSPYKQRGLDPGQLAAMLESHGVYVISRGSLKQAVMQAINATPKSGWVLIIGSLYHIAAARKAVHQWQRHPMAGSSPND